MRPRILILYSRPPWPLTRGPHLQIHDLTRYLRTRYEMDLLYLSEGPIDPTWHAALEENFTAVYGFSFSPWRYRWNALRGLLSSLPLQVHYYRFPEVDRWLNANLGRYQAVVPIHIRMAEYVRGAEIPVVCYLFDAISLTYARAAAATGGLARFIFRLEQSRALRYELEIIRTFPSCVVVSEVDRAFLIAQGATPQRLQVVPIAVRDHLLSRPPYTGMEQPVIAFLGLMSTQANEDAVCFFAKEVLPLIHQRFPQLEFRIVGDNPTKRVRALAHRHPGVTVTGFVEDAWRHLEEALVVVAPVRFGAGMHNKVLEAMALGKALVATSIAGEPVGARDGVHVLIADEPAAFAGAVISLVENPVRRNELGRNAAAWVRNTFSVTAMAKRFERVLQIYANTDTGIPSRCGDSGAGTPESPDR